MDKKWHLIDVDGKVLGKIASEIAHLLMGKGKPDFERYKDIGDYVVVVNAIKVKVTGRKEKQKMYYHHTGYPMGFRSQTFEEIMNKDPRKIIFQAVKGMLPKNRLEDKMLKRLHVFVDEKHDFKDKFN